MIELLQVSKQFNGMPVIDGLSLKIAAGEFVVILGSSGSGKSTLLKMMNRLIEHDSGRILFDGEEIRSFQPEDIRRRMGYAIQSIGLFPHWNVARNIACVPTLLGWPKARIDARVDELMALLQLDPALYRNRFAHQLSGGQQQRVGVARALAANPEVLLMDEPFGALDPVTRAALQQEIARIHRISNKTIVLVTHDTDEALGLASRIVLLDRGRIVQAGTPLEMLASPASSFVRDFFGPNEVGIKLLALQQVGSRVQLLRPGVSVATGEPIAASLSLRDALAVFLDRRVANLAVHDANGAAIGNIGLEDLLPIAQPPVKA